MINQPYVQHDTSSIDDIYIFQQNLMKNKYTNFKVKPLIIYLIETYLPNSSGT